MENIFSHTISRVDYLDGMVRIELVTLAPVAAGQDAADAAANAAVEPRYALHMPLGGFMRGALTLENFIRAMVDRGILPSPAPAAPPAVPPVAEVKPAGSPNFT